MVASLSASTLSTSRFVDRVELKPRRQDQELSQQSEHLQETGLRLAELRMSLLFPPIQPEKDMVAEVEDYEHTN